MLETVINNVLHQIKLPLVGSKVLPLHFLGQAEGVPDKAWKGPSDGCGTERA